MDICNENDRVDNQDDRSSSSEETCDSMSQSDNSQDEVASEYVRLKLPRHIQAYYDKKDTVSETVLQTTENGLVEKVMSNYIIAKKILSNLPWQDKLVCKHVSTTWRSAINTLRKEQLEPVDFFVEVMKRSKPSVTFKKSGTFYTEPLIVLTFATRYGFNLAKKCKDIQPCPCSPPCEESLHNVLDVMQHQIAAPKNCVLTVVNQFTHVPLQQSVMHTNPRMPSSSLMSGLYIPCIPGVEFHILNIRQKNRNTIDMQNDFFDVVDRLAQTRIFKGALVYVTEKYILHSVEDIVFLNYLKDLQPDVPYALAGCIVEDSGFDSSDIDMVLESHKTGKDFVSENLISIGLFTVPKNSEESEQMETNFDVFSLVIESSVWAKAKIQKTINEFANKVPHFEHSVALQLSCVGRDQKHTQEQDFFREVFPNTPIIGCFGNGELGLNNPPRPPQEDPPHPIKRHRRDPGPQGILYSYSTVFMYIGWGKILSAEDVRMRQ